MDGRTLYRTEGSTNVADGNWHMLSMGYSNGTHTRFNNNQIGMYVDGALRNYSY